MTNIILVALMQISAVGAEQGTFEQAYQRSLTTGRPLVVLIGAAWCPACQKMRNSILPQVAEAGGLNKVAFTYVDFDQQRQLASRLSRAKSIPQLIRFDRTASGWKTKCLIGAKSPREVYNFINAGLYKETPVSEASTTNRSRDNVTSTPAKTRPSETATSRSRATSPVHIPQSRRRDVRSSEANKTNGFSYYWARLLNRLSLYNKNQHDSTAYQRNQPSEKRR